MTLDPQIIAELCRKNGITRLRVFGSYARGDQSPQSDLDLIADFAEIPTLLDIVRIERQFAEVLGVPVDLFTDASISSYLRERIMREAKELYERAA